MAASFFNTLRSWLRGPSDETPSLLLDRYGTPINKELAASFTALLIAMSLTDQMLQETEISEIIHILCDELALSPDSAEETLSVALEAHKVPDEVFPKLRSLGLGMTDEQKEHLLKLAMQVANADERISQAESAIVSRLAEVLKLPADLVEKTRRKV